MEDKRNATYFDIPLMNPDLVQQSPWQMQNTTGLSDQLQNSEVLVKGDEAFRESRNQSYDKSTGRDGGVPAGHTFDSLTGGKLIYSRPGSEISARNNQGEILEAWDPMGADYTCPTFNSYDSFDVLASQPPKQLSPEKFILSPEKPATPEDVSLYVSNIPIPMTQEGLRNLFQGAGNVKSCCVLPPSDPSHDKKIGFVAFHSWKEASKAIEYYDGFCLGNDFKLRVKVARNKRRHSGVLRAKDDNYTSDGSSNDANTQLTVNGINGRSDSGSEMDRSGNVSAEKKEVPPLVSEQAVVTKTRSCESTNASSQGGSSQGRPCTKCQKPTTRRCSACKAPYCSRECQKADRSKHKTVCTYQGYVQKPPPAPVQEPPQDDPVDDIDFDCIDISLDCNDYDVKEKPRPSEDGSNSKRENSFSKPPQLSYKTLAPAFSLFPGPYKLLVTTVVSGNTFWAQVVDSDLFPRLVQLTSEMAAMTEGSLERIPEPAVGMLCLTRFAVDGCWYRSRVKQRGDVGKVQVVFVDYGNVEWKAKHEVYYLPLSLSALPAMARLFTLTSVAPSENTQVQRDVTAYLSGLISEKTVVADVVRVVRECNPEVVIRQTGAQQSVNDLVRAHQEGLKSNLGLTTESLSIQAPAAQPCYSEPFNSKPAPAIQNPHSSGVHKKIVPTPPDTPSCASGFKTHMASGVASEVLPPSKTFSVFVSDISSPSLFWIQLPDTSAEKLDILSTLLDVTYRESVFSEYVPIVGELVVAKFTGSLWYRAKIDCIYNDGTLRVTFVDFGNSEDVRLYDVRRITDELVAIPKLAIKCSLAGVETPTEAGGWSAECVQFCKTSMLNKKCKATLQGNVRDTLLLSVQVSVVPDGPVCAVNEGLVARGYAKSTQQGLGPCGIEQRFGAALNNPGPKEGNKHQVGSGNRSFSPVQSQSPDGWSPRTAKKGRNVSAFTYPKALPSNISSNPTTDHYKSSFSSSQSETRSGRYQPLSNYGNGASQDLVSTEPQTTKRKPPARDMSPGNQRQRHLPLPRFPSGAFEVVVNDVVSADEFYTQMVDPQFVHELHKCVRELNEFCKNAKQVSARNVGAGSLGCALFSLDKVWYRARVISVDENGYLVRFIDYGNSEVVPSDAFVDPPESFFEFPPLALCCRLVSSDGSAELWDSRSKDILLSLTRNKQLSCTLVGSPSVPYAVKLEHCLRGQRIDLAEQLRKGLSSHVPHQGNPNPNPSLPRRDSSSSSSSNNARTLSAMTELVLNPALEASGIGRNGERLELMITKVYNPSYFWAQLVSPGNSSELARLTQDLNAHYNNASYPSYEAKVNAFCACKSFPESAWYRGFVRDISSKAVVVHSVDYGRSEMVTEAMLRPLEARFLVQPFRALLCSTSHVEPDEGLWNNEAIEYFRDRVLNKVVKCTVIYNSKARLFIDIQDPESVDGKSLNVDLIAKGVVTEVKTKGISSGNDKPRGPATPETALPQDSLPHIQHVGHTLLREASSVAGKSTAVRSTSSPGERTCQQFGGTSTLTGGISPVVRSASDEVQNTRTKVGCLPVNVRDRLAHIDGTPSQVLNESPQIGVSVHVGRASAHVNSHSAFEKFSVMPGASAQAKPERVMAAQFSSVVVDTRDHIRVLVVDVSGPHEIYFQVAEPDNVGALQSLSETLNTAFANASLSYAPVPGELCCVQFSLDRCWYRAVVTSVDVTAGHAAVQFVDYGNKADVSFSSIRPITPAMTQPPFQARLAYLACVNPDEAVWPQDRRAYLSSVLLGKILMAKVTKVMQDVFEMEFYDTSGEEDIFINALFAQLECPVAETRVDTLNFSPANVPDAGTTLPGSSSNVHRFGLLTPGIGSTTPVEESTNLAVHSPTPGLGLNQPDVTSMTPDLTATISEQIPTEPELEVFVTEVNSPNCFWVQSVVRDIITQFAAMTQRINASCESGAPVLPTVKVGDVCCCKFSSDGQWYRARVEALLGNGLVRVFYVDFGNREEVDASTLKRLDPTLAQLSAQALECTLANVRPAHGAWSTRAVDWLKGIILNKPLFARVIARNGSVLHLELFDTSIPDRDVFINSEMVRTGEAVMA